MSDADNHETRWLDDEPSLRMRGMARDVMLVAPPLMHGPRFSRSLCGETRLRAHDALGRSSGLLGRTVGAGR